MMIREYSTDKNILVLHIEADDFKHQYFAGLYSTLAQEKSVDKVGFNIEFSQNLPNFFFDFLHKLAKIKQVSIFNASPANLALFNIMNYSFSISLFRNKNDFINNKNSIVRRKFFVVR